MGAAQGLDGRGGELIATLVLHVPGVTPNPVPGHVVFLGELIQLLPEIDVFDGLLAFCLPATAFPGRHPEGNPVL
jgi:hypothetical protein